MKVTFPLVGRRDQCGCKRKFQELFFTCKKSFIMTIYKSPANPINFTFSKILMTEFMFDHLL